MSMQKPENNDRAPFKIGQRIEVLGSSLYRQCGYGERVTGTLVLISEDGKEGSIKMDYPSGSLEFIDFGDGRVMALD